jgi:hypothetical protein
VEISTWPSSADCKAALIVSGKDIDMLFEKKYQRYASSPQQLLIVQNRKGLVDILFIGKTNNLLLG